MARYGIEIDINARGVTAEVDRVVAHANAALGRLATRSNVSAPAAARERSAIEVEGAARVQQLRAQGAPGSEIARAEAGVAQALRNYDLATQQKTASLRKTRESVEARVDRATAQLATARENQARTASKAQGQAETRVQKATTDLAYARERLAQATRSQSDRPVLRPFEQGPYTNVAQYVPLSRVRPFRDPSQQLRFGPGTAQYENLKRSIRSEGIREPIVIQINPATGKARVQEGYHRLAVAEELGLKEIPTRFQRVSEDPTGARKIPGYVRPPGHIPEDLRPEDVFRLRRTNAQRIAANEAVANATTQLAVAERAHEAAVKAQTRAAGGKSTSQTQAANAVVTAEKELTNATKALERARRAETLAVQEEARGLGELQQRGAPARGLERAAAHPPPPPPPPRPPRTPGAAADDEFDKRSERAKARAAAAARLKADESVQAAIRQTAQLAGEEREVKKRLRDVGAARVRATEEVLALEEEARSINAVINARMREVSKLAAEQARAANIGGVYDTEIQRRQLKDATDRRMRQELRAAREAELQEKYGPPTRFQRLQAAFHQRRDPDTERSPFDYQRVGAFLGQRALTSAGYAAGAAGLYTVVNGLREGVKAAEELQRVMATIKTQFEAAGEAANFTAFRRDILAIARDTGIAASQVATVGLQMKGAYGDTATAVRETQAAIRATVVTGIEQKELTDSLTAASLAYGVSIESITDKAIGLEERFGVLAKESLKVFGDMATVATQAGLSIDELGALVGSVQQASGVGGAAIAEGFGRILPAVQGASGEILTLYQTTPALAKNFKQVADAIGEGRGGDVLIQLIRDYNELDRSTQNYITTLLGGRREARFLNALFGDTSKVLRELDRTQTDAGKTAERFADIQATLSQTLSRVRETFRQIFDDLARAGLFSLFTTIAGGAEILLRSVSLITRTFANFNEALGGLPGRLAGVAFGLKAIAVAVRAVAAARTFLLTSGLLKGLAGRSAARALAAGAVPGAGPTLGATAVGAAATVGGVDKASALALGQQVAFGAGAAAAARQLSLDFGKAVQQELPFDYGPAAGAGAATASSRSLFRRVGGRVGGFLAGFAALGARQVGPATLPIVSRIAPLLPAAGVLGGVATLGAGAAAFETSRRLLKRFEDLQNIGDRGETRIRDLAKPLGLEELEKRLRNIPTDRSGLKDVLFGRQGLAGLGAFLTGNKTGREVVEEQRDLETVNTYRDALEAGIIKRTKETEKTLEELEKSGGGGAIGREARDRLRSLNRKQRNALKAIGDRRDKNQAILDSGGVELRQTAEQVTQAFQAGEVGYDEYIKTLNATARAFESVKGGDAAFHALVLEARRKATAAVSQAAVAQVSFIQQLNAAAGQDPTKVLGLLIKNIQIPELRPQDAQQLISTYTSIQQGALQRAIQNAPNAAEALRLVREGLEIDPAVRTQIVDLYEQQFGRIQVGGLTGRFGRRQAAQREAERFLPKRIKGDDPAVRAAEDAKLQEDILRIRTEARFTQDPLALARVEQRIAGLLLQRARNDTEILQAEQAAADATRAANAALLGINRSRLAVASSVADDDPLADAQRGVQDAQLVLDNARRSRLGDEAVNQAIAQINEARRAVRDVLRDRVDAQRELARAQVERDPIRLAQLELAAADEEMSRAGNDPAARARALAARIRADRGMRDAIRAISDSQLELLRAYAEAAGRTVEAAQIAVRQAQESLNRVVTDVIAAGGDPNRNAEVNAARGALALAQASARDTQLGESQRQIDVALQLERITTSQAIAQLEALLQIPGITQEQIDNLHIKIKQMRDSLNADYAFNIPNEIRTPTIYEVRRLNQTERQGSVSSYLDNRVVNVQFVNNNASEYAESIERFRDEFDRPPVYGVRPRTY